jgi:RHS repeat-associated protein
MPASTATSHSTTIGPTPTVPPGVATAVATNTRLAYIHEGSTITKAQETQYYPFGMKISPLSNQPVNLGTERNNAFLYNGKEFNDDFGLNWYDYGARFYDPQIARWHSVDPLAENYLPVSPYTYVGNNPILMIDPD